MFTKFALFFGALAITILTLFLSSSAKSLETKASPAKTSVVGHLDTITKLSDMKTDSAIFKKGNRHTLVVREQGEDEDPVENNKPAVPGGVCNQNFAGKARAAAKLSFHSSAYQVFSTTTVLRTTLQTDSFMRHIGLTSASPRTSYEKRNVSITTAFLYGISREGDDDLHLIVGDKNGTKLINCEISGLPPTTNSSYAALKTTRDYIVKYFGTDFCSTTGYTLFKPTLPITIRGTLFYDIDHAPGSIGPMNYHPPTAWEIHPIANILF